MSKADMSYREFGLYINEAKMMAKMDHPSIAKLKRVLIIKNYRFMNQRNLFSL